MCVCVCVCVCVLYVWCVLCMMCVCYSIALFIYYITWIKASASIMSASLWIVCDYQIQQLHLLNSSYVQKQ